MTRLLNGNKNERREENKMMFFFLLTKTSSINDVIQMFLLRFMDLRCSEIRNVQTRLQKMSGSNFHVVLHLALVIILSTFSSKYVIANFQFFSILS